MVEGRELAVATEPVAHLLHALPDPNSDMPLLSGQGDLTSDVRLLAWQVQQVDKKLDRFFDEVKSNYATKTEISGLKEDVDSLKSSLGWVVKSIVGAVLAALIGAVLVKGGVAH